MSESTDRELQEKAEQVEPVQKLDELIKTLEAQIEDAATMKCAVFDQPLLATHYGGIIHGLDRAIAEIRYTRAYLVGCEMGRIQAERDRE